MPTFFPTGSRLFLDNASQHGFIPLPMASCSRKTTYNISSFTNVMNPILQSPFYPASKHYHWWILLTHIGTPPSDFLFSFTSLERPRFVNQLLHCIISLTITAHCILSQYYSITDTFAPWSYKPTYSLPKTSQNLSFQPHRHRHLTFPVTKTCDVPLPIIIAHPLPHTSVSLHTSSHSTWASTVFLAPSTRHFPLLLSSLLCS